MEDPGKPSAYLGLIVATLGISLTVLKDITIFTLIILLH